jgi:hypothetical protein
MKLSQMTSRIILLEMTVLHIEISMRPLNFKEIFALFLVKCLSIKLREKENFMASFTVLLLDSCERQQSSLPSFHQQYTKIEREREH